jgi:hypothetical protein
MCRRFVSKLSRFLFAARVDNQCVRHCTAARKKDVVWLVLGLFYGSFGASAITNARTYD